MMIDADKLPVRDLVVVRRKVGRKGKPWYAREQVKAVLLADLRKAAARKPRNRMERIRRMGPEELAWRLLTIQGDGVGYCRMKPECLEALENDTGWEITEANCLECIKAWLLEEV